MYRRRIGEYPHFHQHVYRPSLPSCLMTCACDSLSLSYMATRTGLYLRRSRWSYLPLACRRSWSNVLHTFHSLTSTSPLPDSASIALTADSVPLGAQIARSSLLDRVSLWIARAEQVWMWVAVGLAR